MSDLSHIPQLHETPEQHAARMQWFRDAKFGMFIHWGPCSLGAREIGWGREASRPWDINSHGPRNDDEEYDNYYKRFNPVKFDADAWAKLASDSGMRYMVLVTKHHDGFSMFDTKLSDYDIMATPYGRDIVEQFVAACHKHGLKAGLYYSTRDWYHPDYLVGDNAAYDAWYRGQIEELLTNYGQVDVMWFDHVGGRNWGLWQFDELFSMMYRLQPNLLVNNRAARFCGPPSPQDQEPTEETLKLTAGDYDTPEGRIGSINLDRDWESCIHIGQGWSYRGEDGFKTPENCIRMLVSCVTGGGNLLLNMGPRPDGTLADGEVAAAKALGAWMKKNSEAVYGTRGGPYHNGNWGGSCHKGNTLYLHILRWLDGDLELQPLPQTVLAAQTMSGEAIEFEQSDEGLRLSVPEALRDDIVTVLALTLDAPIEEGTLFPRPPQVPGDLSEYGRIVSEHATLTMSNASQHDVPADHPRLFAGAYSPNRYAFCAGPETNPWVRIDLGARFTVNAVVIENRENERSTDGLILSVSTDGETWDHAWQADDWEQTWFAKITRFHAGIEAMGRPVRYLRLETNHDQPSLLLLQRLTVYGE